MEVTISISDVVSIITLALVIIVWIKVDKYKESISTVKSLIKESSETVIDMANEIENFKKDLEKKKLKLINQAYKSTTIQEPEAMISTPTPERDTSDNKFPAIMRLSREGKTIKEISRELDTPEAEVELLIRINKSQ